jgi:hypothetical protein
VNHEQMKADPRIATLGIWNSGLVQPKIPVFYGVQKPVGHGGTYNQDTCSVCKDESWVINSGSLP